MIHKKETLRKSAEGVIKAHFRIRITFSNYFVLPTYIHVLVQHIPNRKTYKHEFYALRYSLTR